MDQSYPYYQCFPSTSPPPHFVTSIASAFRSNRERIDTIALQKGLTSNDVLAVVRPDLIALGFDVEASKLDADKLRRPVFFGPQGEPTLKYEIDGYHAGWRCGIEIEAGRAWIGNAVYRDLIQAMVMADVDYLTLAVPATYKFNSGGKQISSNAFENTKLVATALYGHSRVSVPYGLILIGY